jgi:hypothetical protein
MLIDIDYPCRRLLIIFASTAGQELTMMPIDDDMACSHIAGKSLDNCSIEFKI